MTEPVVADAAQRGQALDIGRSFIVQAPAGSGKTELLTQRYLRLLAIVAQPEEIYAITFTRKAAAEMRHRIVSALTAAQGPQPEAAHARLTWSLARAALARDEEQHWAIAANPNRLRIQTFDSLAHALARQLPLLSEFGTSPNTSEQATAYYHDAARATLRQLEDDQLGSDLEHLLTHLDGNRGQLESLLAGMLSRRDQWLPQVIREPDVGALDDALQSAVGDHLAELADSSDPGWLEDLVGIARIAAINARGNPKSPPALSSWDAEPTPLTTAWEDLPRWRGLADLLLTAKGELRRRWDNALGFPAPSDKGIGADEKARRKQAKEQAARCAEALADDALRERWQTLRLLPASGLGDEQARLLGSLLRVLLHAVAELMLAFREGGEVDFAETQIRAQRALGDPETPTDTALALDYHLKHLLIDEFQDTSSSQYRLLMTLTATWLPGDGRTLFAVGDPMQSIYRFREAEVGLFLAARQHGIGGLPLEPLTLSVNFRSSAGIVEWVNDGFTRLFPDRVDIARGAVPYSPSQAFAAGRSDNAVSVHPFGDADHAIEAQHVVDLVSKALDETDDGKVAILGRARSHLAAIADAMGNAGIRFQAVDIAPLGQQPVVRDLFHLTRALLHPADRLAWLVVLRAPWLGIDLAAMLHILEGSSGCVPERLADPPVIAGLDPDNRRRVERLLSVVAPHLPARGRRPLREWIESLWLQLGGAAMLSARERDDAEAFLNLLSRHEEAGGLVDFAALEDALGSLYAAPDNGADIRVQLMTMHKAKGLEFDTVILPGLGRPPANAKQALLYWLERTSADGDVSLLMAPVRAAREQAEPISDYLRAVERDKSMLETTRLLYVAATRAKRRLHLLGHVKFNDAGEQQAPAAGSLLKTLWPVAEPHYAALQAPEVAAQEVRLTAVNPLRRLPADWQPDLSRLPRSEAQRPTGPDAGSAIEFNWAGDTARHVGTLVHRQLERIANDGIGHWPAERVDALVPSLRAGLRNLGVTPDQLESATAKAQRALRNTLNDETGRWILTAHQDASCEWPLTIADDKVGHYVIDRSFIDDDGTRWIIDYKTGDHLEDDIDAFLDEEVERYRAQLDNYGRIIRLIESRPIKLALYFPLFAAWRVWDYPG